MNINHRASDGSLVGDIVYDLNCVLMSYKKANKLDLHQLKEMRANVENVIKYTLVECSKLESSQTKDSMERFRRGVILGLKKPREEEIKKLSNSTRKEFNLTESLTNQQTGSEKRAKAKIKALNERDKANEKKRSTAKALQSKGILRGTVQKGKK